MINIVYKSELPEDKKFQYQTRFSSGADLIAQRVYEIPPGQTAVVKTGVFIADFTLEDLEEDYIPELQVRPRSSMSKKGLLVHLGTIDPDFRAEIGVSITNVSDRIYYISTGDRIAQLVCAVVYRPKCIPIAQKVRESGWGSTGV